MVGPQLGRLEWWPGAVGDRPQSTPSYGRWPVALLIDHVKYTDKKRVVIRHTGRASAPLTVIVFVSYAMARLINTA